MLDAAVASKDDRMVSLGDYPLRQADQEKSFFGNRLVYLFWEYHLMFAAPTCVPLPPELPFGLLVSEVLPEIYGEHPEFEQIDWKRVEWFKSNKRFYPDFGKSLRLHGIEHKDLIRFKTPRLNGIRSKSSL